MYNKSKDQIYQNTANMLKAASSYREVILPVSEVAIQFSELLNEVRKGASAETEQPTEKKTKGGKKSKED